MSYASQGKRSLAWWLQAVKWFGKDGNKGVMRGGEVPTHQVKAAMEDLLNRRYISRAGGGKGKRDLSYSLTETGGRYLDEHGEELKSPVEPEESSRPAVEPKSGAAQPNVNHPVPQLPQWTGPPMPGENKGPAPRGRPPSISVHTTPEASDKTVEKAVELGVAIAQHVATNGGVPVDDTQHPAPGNDIVRHAIPEPRASLNTPDKPEKPSSAAAIYDPAAADRSKFAAQLRSALADMLFDKYADQITVSQLIDYVEAEQ